MGTFERHRSPLDEFKENNSKPFLPELVSRNNRSEKNLLVNIENSSQAYEDAYK